MPASDSHQYVSGHLNKILFTVSGSGNEATLDVTDHSLEEEVTTILVTNSASAGVAWRIASVLDAKGSFKLFYDLYKPPYSNPPYLVPGVVGTAEFYVSVVDPNTGSGAERYYTVPLIIKKSTVTSQLLGAVEYQIEVELNGLAGSFVRPTS